MIGIHPNNKGMVAWLQQLHNIAESTAQLNLIIKVAGRLDIKSDIDGYVNGSGWWHD